MNRLFNPEPEQNKLATYLYGTVEKMPLICPHGHVDPGLFADPNYTFENPVELFIIPDHYVFRMLYSQGIPLEELGIQRVDGQPVENDPRKIWQIFAEHYYLFRGTPTGLWLNAIFADDFGINEKLSGLNARAIYNAIDQAIKTPRFNPRRLYEQYHIEVLCTTDAATDPLARHQSIRASGWNGRIIPTFRPDAVINLEAPGWRTQVDQLSQLSGIDVNGFTRFIQALENRRAYFKRMGATATDHGAISPYTAQLTPGEAETIFQRALAGKLDLDDSRRFMGHMLIEMARMSVEDGLVMQLHVGSYRNHNSSLFQVYGADKGADIPIATEYTRNLAPLLNRYGNDPRLSLILFTLDESTYSRELAPLAGHYPALRLGPPWWFNDSPNGMLRFLDAIMETTGIYNTAGFNDDTRAFLSIPVRHDVWRRICSDWLASLVLRGRIDEEDAVSMIADLSYGLAKKAYRL